MKYLALTFLVLIGCPATDSSVDSSALCPGCEAQTSHVQRDMVQRERLLNRVKALEGRWQFEGEEDAQIIEFSLTAGGSVVKETMFPGQPHEMTNMYSLDGNTLVMTHYCGAGNQPHMRATELDSGNLAFKSFAVGDLASKDAMYMDSMTLVFVDENTIEERWTNTVETGSSEMPAFRLKRVN